MAEHDGSFLSLESLEALSSSDDCREEDSDGEFREEDILLSVSCNKQHDSSADKNNCKKRHSAMKGHSAVKGHSKKCKRRSTAIFSTALSDQPSLSAKSRRELGISGLLPIEDVDTLLDDPYTDVESEMAGIFPTPSPLCSHKSLLGRNKEEFMKHCQFECSRPFRREISKNRAINIFDSPEDGKRGWSELGLRLRRDNHRVENTDEQITGDSYFEFVADEVILSIFQKMPKFILVQCAQVCRRWRRIAYDESLWRRLDLSNKKLEDGQLGSLVTTRGVQYLKLSSTLIEKFHFKHSSNEEFGLELCRIQCLDLSMAITSHETLTELFARCKYLKQLSIETLSVNEKICRLIGQNLQLTTLNCAMATGITPLGLEHIFGCCTKLDELNIAWIKLPIFKVDQVIQKLSSHLRKLNFSGCREFMDDISVKLLVSVCPELVDLDLSDSLGVSEFAVKCISRGLPKLHTLHLSRCYYILPQGFRYLLTLPHLKTLNIYSMMLEPQLKVVREDLSLININVELFSSIARPTVGMHRTSIWGHRVRDIAV